MASEVILVNGLPGSGKSTLAVGLAANTSACLLPKDAVKEALASLLPDSTIVAPLGAIAMDTMWALAGALPGTVIVESWWFRPRDLPFAAIGLRRVRAAAVVEIWCDVPAGVAEDRYRKRSRHAMYEDKRHLVDDWPQWRAQGRPLELCPVLRVDTSQPVDHVAVASSALAALEASKSYRERNGRRDAAAV